MKNWMHGLSWAALAVAAAGSLVACDAETEPAQPLGTDYYPVKVGDYRVFAVQERTWANDVPTVVQYQLQERVAETFTDATGQLSYRIIRARRNLATDAWRDDSVYVLTPTTQTLQLLSQNRRSIELVFPVKEGRRWNPYAFADVDTLSRRYTDVGKARQVGQQNYASTVTTIDDGQDNAFYYTTRRQVFAKGVGPVARLWRNYSFCGFNGEANGCQAADSSYIEAGRDRVETLVEMGPR